MATASEVLAWEASQVGHVGGGRYWQMMGYGYTDSDAPPWCLCFQCAAFKRSGVDVPGLPWYGCSSWYRWLRANRPDMLVSTPRPGDLVLYDWGVDDEPCDHVGMVLSYGQGSYVVSREGNTTGNSVADRTRPWSAVRAFVRIPYEEEEMTAAEWSKLEKMLGQMEQRIYQNVGVKVWGFRNPDLEARDCYQIVRDIRNALGISDGQKVTATTSTNVGWDKSIIRRIAQALGIKQ